MSGDLLVATCGNVDAGDDAFGPRVGRALRAAALEGVEVVDLDLRPAALLDHLGGRSAVVLVDAVRADVDAHDALLVLDLQEETLPALCHDDALSTHGLGLADQIALARQLDLLPPRVWLVGAPLRAARIGESAGPALDEQVDEAVEAVARIAGSVRART